MSEKKRSTYSKKSKLDLPEGLIDRKKFGYRWIKASSFEQTSYDYEPRGWEKALDAEGKIIRNGDLVLGRMAIDMHNEMKEQKESDRVGQMKLMFENQAAQEEKDSHEFRKKGGKIKFEFSQE